MSIQLVHKLEEKVDQALETIDMLRLEIEDLSKVNKNLQHENAELKNRQGLWEQSLASLLRKLSNTDLTLGNASVSERDLDLREIIQAEEDAIA